MGTRSGRPLVSCPGPHGPVGRDEPPRKH